MRQFETGEKTIIMMDGINWGRPATVISKMNNNDKYEVYIDDAGYSLFVREKYLRRTKTSNPDFQDINEGQLVHIVEKLPAYPKSCGKYGHVTQVFKRTICVELIDKEKSRVYCGRHDLVTIPHYKKAWAVYDKIIREEKLVRRYMQNNDLVWITDDGYHINETSLFDSFAEAATYFKLFNYEKTSIIRVKDDTRL